jgi:hypothetical protein
MATLDDTGCLLAEVCVCVCLCVWGGMGDGERGFEGAAVAVVCVVRGE